ALTKGEALLLPLQLDQAMLQTPQQVPVLLRGLVRTTAPRKVAAGPETASTLKQKLASLSVAEQEKTILALVCTQTALVLGHATPDAIDDGRSFKELGFDSLTALELRNRLNSATDLHLSATLVFDYPTPTVLAGYLQSELHQEEIAPDAIVLAEIDKL